MSFTTGNKYKITLFGTSHGDCIGCTIEGIPEGLEIDFEKIDTEMKRRKPQGTLTTKRKETDNYDIISGVLDEICDGSPLTCVIPNTDAIFSDYNKDIPRPGHADYAANIKYNGYNDYRGGGFFSGRMTAPLVFAGAVAKQILEKKGIYVYSHILSVKDSKEASFSDLDCNTIINRLREIKTYPFPCLEKEKEFINIIKENSPDSVGGVCEIMVLGVPVGVGEPFFDSIESTLSKLFFSVPGIKGVEFGDGFKITELTGSVANDCPHYIKDEITFLSNHSGGINGGLANGMPIICRVAVRPTPSVSIEQETVDLEKGENTKLTVHGRHDRAIILRIAPVMEAVTAMGILDLL